METRYRNELRTLGKALAAVAGKLDAMQAGVIADKVALAVRQASLGDQVEALLTSTPALLEQMQLDQKRTRQWIEMCKYPWAATTYHPDRKSPIVFPPPPEKPAEPSLDRPRQTTTPAGSKTK